MKAEKDCAAERIRRKEAVRLDLKNEEDRDEFGGGSEGGVDVEEAISLDLMAVLGLLASRGWSVAQSSPTDVDKLFCRPLLVRLAENSPGVSGLPTELRDPVSSSSDGIDSVDSDRTEDRGPSVVSLPTLLLSC